MKNRLISKLRMPDGSINPWVIAVTVTLATFMPVVGILVSRVDTRLLITFGCLVSAGATANHAADQAHSMIYGTVQRQSAMLVFLDNFKLLGVVFLVVIPVLLLMKRPTAPSGNVPVH